MPGPTAKPVPANRTPRQPGKVTKSVHDDLNRGIISILQNDGRTAYSTIAAELGVSEGAIRKRVSQLQKSGAIRIVAVVDPMELSYDAYTMLGIQVSPNAKPEAVAQRLSNCPEVAYAIWVSGNYDLLIEVIFEDRERLVDFLSEEIYGYDDIMNCNVMHSLKVIKNQYQLKPDFERK